MGVYIPNLTLRERVFARNYALDECEKVRSYDAYENAYRLYALKLRNGRMGDAFEADVATNCELRMREMTRPGGDKDTVHSRALAFGVCVSNACAGFFHAHAGANTLGSHAYDAREFVHVTHDKFRQARYLLYIMHTSGVYDEVIAHMSHDIAMHAARGTLSPFCSFINSIQYCQTYYAEFYGTQLRADVEDGDCNLRGMNAHKHASAVREQKRQFLAFAFASTSASAASAEIATGSADAAPHTRKHNHTRVYAHA
jgi:hypothetical protein